jgi:DNA-binding IclR family transcriptional regulator
MTDASTPQGGDAPGTVRLVSKPDRRAEILHRMAAEWSETPDLRLRLDEVQARWRLAPDTCAQLLDLLVDAELLERQRDGRYGWARRD